MLNNEYTNIKETLIQSFKKNKIMKIITNALITLIKGYRYLISPLLGSACRYLPTCSEYSIEALKTYGFFKGSWLSLKEFSHVIRSKLSEVVKVLILLLKK